MWQFLRSAFLRRRRRRSQRSVRQRSHRHRLQHQLLEDRRLLVGDVQIRYEFTSTSDQVLQSLQVNQDFRLRVFVSDIRSTPAGVLEAFLDINYPAALASSTGGVTPGPAYSVSASGSTSVAGLIDEAGGFDTDQLPPNPRGREVLLFTVPLRANAAGTLALTQDPAENPTKQVVLFDGVSGIQFSRIDFVGGSIPIVAAGVQLSRTTGLVTNEVGGTDTLTAQLTTQPTADVTFALSSSNTNEGTVSPTSVTFTVSNWNVPQTITVRGVDDVIDDGDVAYNIITGAATSTDSRFSGQTIADVSVTNVDNDTAGVIVTPTSGLLTNELGATATFQVTLATQPLSNVTIGLTSSNLNEGTVSPGSLIFTTANWNLPQTVTVSGVDDFVDDANIAYSIITAPAVSSDSVYNNLNPADVLVTNNNNDTAGITVNPQSGLATTEAGGTQTFSIRLNSQPTSNVVIGLSSTNINEGVCSASSVTFTPENWNIPQVLTVTGVDDNVTDGTQSYQIITAPATSSDPKYNGLDSANVTLTNLDNDIPGVTVSPTSGLMTTENSGAATFQVVLNSQPTSSVTIGLSSSDTTEGNISVNSLLFTTANWNVPQTVTVTGVNDDLVDGSVAYMIITAAAVSSDPQYNNRDVADVNAINVDNDTPGVQVTPISGLTTTEAAGTATFTIRLTAQPTANVTIGLSSDDTSEGTVSTPSVTFTTANWNIPQTIIVTGVDDMVVDGPVTYTIVTAATVSSDSAFSGLAVADVMLTNSDNDVAGISISPLAGLVTSETGQTASFQISLTSQPSANVTIGLTSSDTTEGTIAISSVTFTPQNWNSPQTITITGMDDLLDDGDVIYRIVTAAAVSTDSNYSALDAADLSVTNLDDDVPGIAITPTTGLVTSESGQIATFQIVLTGQPSADVVINLSSSNTNEGTVSVPSVTFTNVNWNTPQLITIRGVDDNVVDGSQAYTIVTAAAISADAIFNGVNPPDVSVTNQDNDTTALNVTAVTANEGTGNGQTSFVFQVTLSTAVASSFMVDFNTADGTAIAANGDYLAASGTLTFAGTAGETQSITVRVNQDNIVEADETFEVRLANLTAISASLAQQITLPSTLTRGTIINDDSAMVTIVGPAATLEGSSTTDTPLSFRVQLSNAVQGGFTLAYNTNDGTATLLDNDYSDNDGTLTFIGTAGETQTITVAVRADDRVETDETLNVTLGALSNLPATAADAITVSISPAIATILNDDVPRLLLTDITTSHVEGSGGTTSVFRFQVTLTDAVADGFDVPFTVNDGTATVANGDYQDNDGSLHFNGSAGETQVITVLVNHDTITEANETFSIALGTLVGLEASQTVNVAIRTLTATIENDDLATVNLASTSASQTEGGLFQYTVTLSNAVQGGFTISYATSDGTATVAGGDYLSTSGTLMFLGAASESQTFTVMSTADAQLESDENFAVTLGQIAGLPTGITVTLGTSMLTSTILDDDSASLTLSAVQTSRTEGNSGTIDFVFNVTLSAAVQGGFQVAYTTNDRTATVADNDYLDNDGSLAFVGTAGESHSITVRVIGDQNVEPDELFDVALGAITGLNVGVLSRLTEMGTPITATILNDDNASITITGPGILSEGTGGGTTAFDFTVTLTGATGASFTLPYQTLEGTATLADNDFVANNGSLMFSGTAGETHNIRVLINQDARVEADETFQVRLGQVSGLPVAIASLLTVNTSPVMATILNDDSATIAFVNSSSNALEANGQQSVAVRLSVTGGGALTQAVTVNVVVRSGGTATASDFTLSTTSISFPAGSVDGAIQNVVLSIVNDNVAEIVETVILGLEIVGNGSSPVSLGPIATHTVSITDDPVDGVLSGRVWVDADGNGVMNVGELTIPGVTIRLVGTTLIGEIISRQTTTDSNGVYRFANLPAGTYSLTQQQPTEFIDGAEIIGTIGGGSMGTMTNDQFNNIVMRPSQVGSGYNFGERGLRAEDVNRVRILSRPRTDVLLGNPIT